jgi:hypothetical protein
VILDDDFDLRINDLRLANGNIDHSVRPLLPDGSGVGFTIDWMVPAIPAKTTAPTHPAYPARRLLLWIRFIKTLVVTPVAPPPTITYAPLTANQQAFWNEMKFRRKGGVAEVSEGPNAVAAQNPVDSLRKKLSQAAFASDAVSSLAAPSLIQPFGSHGAIETQRGFYRLETYLIDSDNDGYSDSGELAVGTV